MGPDAIFQFPVLILLQEIAFTQNAQKARENRIGNTISPPVKAALRGKSRPFSCRRRAITPSSLTRIFTATALLERTTSAAEIDLAVWEGFKCARAPPVYWFRRQCLDAMNNLSAARIYTKSKFELQ